MYRRVKRSCYLDEYRQKSIFYFLMFICFHVLLAGTVFAGDTAHPRVQAAGELFTAVIESE